MLRQGFGSMDCEGLRILYGSEIAGGRGLRCASGNKVMTKSRTGTSASVFSGVRSIESNDISITNRRTVSLFLVVVNVVITVLEALR